MLNINRKKECLIRKFPQQLTMAALKKKLKLREQGNESENENFPCLQNLKHVNFHVAYHDENACTILILKYGYDQNENQLVQKQEKKAQV